jgi:hypothetical protein
MATHSITYTTVKHLPGRLALEVRAACKDAYVLNDEISDILRGINYRMKDIKTGNNATTDQHYRVALNETGKRIDVIHLKANGDDDQVMVTITAEP